MRIKTKAVALQTSPGRFPIRSAELSRVKLVDWLCWSRLFHPWEQCKYQPIFEGG